MKLLHSENSEHSSHVGAMFARLTIQHLEEVARFLGPEEVIFHSQENKARVPIGLTTGNKQAPLLMHVKYKVKLPDHDCNYKATQGGTIGHWQHWQHAGES